MQIDQVRAQAFKSGLTPSAVAGQLSHFDTPSDPPPAWRTHPPIRALPTSFSDRALPMNDVYFLSESGSDSNNGTDPGTPWQTLLHARSQLGPGDTLVLLDGIIRSGYDAWPTSFSWNVSGTERNPITIRGDVDALAILDGGWKEFYLNPDTAWEPVPASLGGVEGEYMSTRPYPLTVATRQIGAYFAESMIPLSRYQRLEDLRSTNEYHKKSLSDGGSDPVGYWAGPGLMWHSETGRIHIRLSHTHIPQLATYDYLNLGHDLNYTGETDPRNLALILCHRTELRFNASHLRLCDFVIRGFHNLVGFGTAGHKGIALDRVTFYAGGFAPASGSGADELTMTRCQWRGYNAPWHSRWATKNRFQRSALMSITARRATISRCEFTDHHDGAPHIRETCLALDYSRNFIDNMCDDGLYLPPRQADAVHHIYLNHFGGATSMIAWESGGQGVDLTNPASGFYICRNLFELEREIFNSPDSLDGPMQNFRTTGAMFQEHDKTDPANVYLYHNTVATRERGRRYFYGMGSLYQPADWFVRNNIHICQHGRPHQQIAALTGSFTTNNNLFWGYVSGSAGSQPGDVHANPNFEKYTDDWRDGRDYRVQVSSPARLAGHPIPTAWRDELRHLDAVPATPTIGAIPYGVSGVVFGPASEV